MCRIMHPRCNHLLSQCEECQVFGASWILAAGIFGWIKANNYGCMCRHSVRVGIFTGCNECN